MGRLIGSIRKNALEEVRVSLEEYKGHKFLDVRVFFLGKDGQMHPTKRGIALTDGLLPEVCEILSRAGDEFRSF